MKTTIWLLTLLFTLGLSSIDIEAANVRGTLILATNDGSGVESSLKKYERQLRRLNFDSFRSIGRGSSGVPGTMNLGNGYRVQLNSSGSNGDSIPLDIKWMRRDDVLIHTRSTLRRNSPVILGGPRYQGGNLILVLEGG